MKSVMHTVLVIGDKQEEKIKRYALETEVEPYVKYRKENASAYRTSRARFLKSVLESDDIKLNENQRELYKDAYLDTMEMSDEEYYDEVLTADCDVDEDTGDAYSTENPNARYMSARCYDERLKKEGEEATFSTPFKLKNGFKAYIAKKGDIDWGKMHMGNTQVYEAAWELCVEGREPVNDMEDTIKTNMQNRVSYFANFASKEEYVRHSCSFWCYSVITENGDYYELDYNIRDKEWVADFYERFVKNLPDDTTLSIYEVRNLN